MQVRGLRGATVAEADTPEAIRAAARELLEALAAANALDAADIASVIFSVTPDLTAEPPARAARDLGWDEAAIMCLAEMPVPGGPPRCIRVLIHWNTDKRPAEVRHVYLHAAGQLRPDRAARNGRPDRG
jgi:chorismate mutase